MHWPIALVNWCGTRKGSKHMSVMFADKAIMKKYPNAEREIWPDVNQFTLFVEYYNDNKPVAFSQSIYDNYDDRQYAIEALEKVN